MIARNIFLYHLDHEIHKLFRIHTTYSHQVIYNCFKLITRLAYLLSTKSIIIPASNYFESDIAFKIINELAPLNEFGVIHLASSSLTLEDLLNKKSVQHPSPNQRYYYDDFRNQERESPLYLPGTLITRKRSAGADIQKCWLDSIGSGSIWAKLFMTIQGNFSIDKFESIMYSVPDLLEGKAFISEYVVPLLPLDANKIQMADTLLNNFITQCYVKSFLDEYDAMCFSNIPLIVSERILPSPKDNTNYIPYNTYVENLQAVTFQEMSVKDYINQCSAFELVAFKTSPFWKREVQRIEETILHPNSNYRKTFIIPRTESTVNHIIFEGDFIMGDKVKGDKYEAKMVGVQGKNAGQDAIITQSLYEKPVPDVNFDEILDELAKLRKYLDQNNETQESHKLINDIDSVEDEIRKGKKDIALQKLKSFGEKAKDIITQAGCSVLAEIIARLIMS